MKTPQFTPTEISNEQRIEEVYGDEPRRVSFVESDVRKDTLEALKETDWESRMEWAKAAFGLCKVGSGKGSWE